MRIGFDMLAVQSPTSRNRGIGRYVHHLVTAMLANHVDHDFFLYYHDQLPADRIPFAKNTNIRDVRIDSERGESSVAQAMDRLTRTNCDGLDILVIPSPFEYWSSYQPPSRPASGLTLAAVVHDTIPFLFPNEETVDPLLIRLYRHLEVLRRYDVLLANSESTRQDFLSLLGLPETRVVTIGAAGDGKFFVPDANPISAANRRTLKTLGIHRPFVLNVGGMCPRKNNERLIDAFALLPKWLQREYQLVLSFAVDDGYREHLRRRARSLGVGNALVVTNYVSDETLRLLYQRCAAFAFPSRYEGFGLPILEAMHCGAAVIAGNNSSQVEVVGDAGLLVNVDDPAELAVKLSHILQEPELAKSLQERALIQAGKFSWDRTAERAMTALTGLHPCRRTNWTRVHRPRAFFSPFPPRKSGISDYSASLLQELKLTYEIDLYHDAGYVPEPALQSDEFMCCDARLFPRYAAAKDYYAVLYQMGNSAYHDFMYETMLRYPGIVTLHDFSLVGYHLHRGQKQGRPREYILDELLRCYPEQAEDVRAMLDSSASDWHRVVEQCGRRGWFLNQSVIDAADRLVMHSPWCMEQVRAASPWDAERVIVIPQGARACDVSPDERARIRERFGLSRDALVVAAFGFVSETKMTVEALDAFRAVASADESAVFLFAGEETDHGDARRHAAELGLNSRVRFLGRQLERDFCDVIAATDVGVNLRRPPTNGETSAALLQLLASGVPTLVTDVATFSDYPDATVRKVRWDAEGPAELRRAMLELSSDPSVRERIGRTAREYAAQRHDWSNVAQLYAEVIEDSHAERAAANPRVGERSAGTSPVHAASGAIA